MRRAATRPVVKKIRHQVRIGVVRRRVPIYIGPATRIELRKMARFEGVSVSGMVARLILRHWHWGMLETPVTRKRR